ncbi:MAG: low affinity potassium transporter [Trizodia sp. TS-e1964]|nr:MAG: low affinity potassium transporter [Trizodia sp. TS-e1964]
MIANPIFINTFLVFVRLYWFEKRFQNIVHESRSSRRTTSRSKGEAQERRDIGHEERGVGGRAIKVIHQGQGTPTNVGSKPSDTHGIRADIGSSVDSTENLSPLTQGFKPQQVGSSSSNFPNSLISEQHIAFLKHQGKENEQETLRIPGPIDYERGLTPQILEEDQDLVISATRDLKSKAVFEKTNQDDDEMVLKKNNIIDALKHGKKDGPNNRSFGRRYSITGGPLAPLPRVDTMKSRARAESTSSHKERIAMPYLSWQPTIGRNSVFFDLTEKQREELGGIEYRSLKTLAAILVSYFFLVHLFGVVCLLPWYLQSKTYGPLADKNSYSKVWWGIFTPASMFNDLGYTLNPDSMIPFQRAVFPLLLGSFLIIIGNTGFPCMLRYIIWMMSLLVPKDSGIWEELKFLLDHPRRCFTLLFQRKATWILFSILVVLNGLDLLFFIVLDLHDSVITDLPASIQVLDGWFQAVSTRTAGFGVVNLALLHPAIQVSYMIMMYISVFPIAISVRRTNVYEEKSLGIYGSKDDENEEDSEPSYIGAHLRRQLSFDLWYIFLGLFIVTIAEGERIRDPNDPQFTVFSCLFELVSSYGNVGLSLGYPNINASFCAEFSTISKLIIIAMQIRGRHRGLPYELDRAIMLPSEVLHAKEDVEANHRMHRRLSSLSLANREPRDKGTTLNTATATGFESGTDNSTAGLFTQFPFPSSAAEQERMRCRPNTIGSAPAPGRGPDSPRLGRNSTWRESDGI